MDSRLRAIYKIEPQPSSPAQARRIIADELGARVPAAVLDEIKLMVSELVTAGIVHGAEREEMLLDLLVNGNVRCRVCDHGAGFAKRTREPGPDDGWGLQVVEELADRWGMQCSPHRTEVWFERRCA